MSLGVETFVREVTTHRANGPTTAKHAFTSVTVDLGNGQILKVEVDAGDWSRALALGVKVPVRLELVPGTARTA